MSRQLVETAIAGFVGKRPWGVRLGVGSFLTMEFGRPVKTSQDSRLHGEWHLWLYMCDWRLESSGKFIVDSSDERHFIEEALNDVKLGHVTRIGVTEPALDLSISFESGHLLKTLSSESAEEKQWILFTPDHIAVTVNGDGSYVCDAITV